MADYYVLFKQDAKGSPVHLEANLLPEFYAKKPFEGSVPYQDVSWRTSLHQKVKLPEALWLITTDRLYLFDCYPAFGGFIMSREFVDLLHEFDSRNYEKVKLQVVNKRNEPIKAKEYYYVKFHSGLDDAIDLDQSKYDRDKQGGYIKKYHEVYLTDTSKPDVFVVNNLVLMGKLFCSEAFRIRAESLGMYGIVFVPVKEAGNYKVVFKR